MGEEVHMWRLSEAEEASKDPVTPIAAAKARSRAREAGGKGQH